MSKAQVKNLDIRCAELGRELANILGMEERVLNAALAVLEEQGPYAMFLYLQARHEKVAKPTSNESPDFSSKSLDFLKDVFKDQLGGADDILDAVKRLAEDLDNLLFARDLLRVALSYARYHLKAKGRGAP